MVQSSQGQGGSRSPRTTPVIVVDSQSTLDQLLEGGIVNPGRLIRYAGDPVQLLSGEIKRFRTGLKIYLPQSIIASIRPYSLLSEKGILMPDSPRIISSDFTQELEILLFNAGISSYSFSFGDRIATLTFERLATVTVRFGNTPPRRLYI